MMEDSLLKLLSKADLIEIIKSDTQWKRKATYRMIALVGRKIEDILDKQEKLDFATIEGRIKYLELEKEYEKWNKIQQKI